MPFACALFEFTWNACVFIAIDKPKSKSKKKESEVKEEPARDAPLQGLDYMERKRIQELKKQGKGKDIGRKVFEASSWTIVHSVYIIINNLRLFVRLLLLFDSNLYSIWWLARRGDSGHAGF